MSKDCVPLSHSKVHVMLLDRNYPASRGKLRCEPRKGEKGKGFNDTLCVPDKVETIHLVPLCGGDKDISK